MMNLPPQSSLETNIEKVRIAFARVLGKPRMQQTPIDRPIIEMCLDPIELLAISKILSSTFTMSLEPDCLLKHTIQSIANSLEHREAVDEVTTKKFLARSIPCDEMTTLSTQSTQKSFSFIPLNNIQTVHLSDQPTTSATTSDQAISVHTPIVNKPKKNKVPGNISMHLNGTYQTSFWVHESDGTTDIYGHLGKFLGREYPVQAFSAYGPGYSETPPFTIEDTAKNFIETIRKVQPKGPYIIGGYSYGGLVAYEVAQQLAQKGTKISGLILFDPLPAGKKLSNSLYQSLEQTFYSKYIDKIVGLTSPKTKTIKGKTTFSLPAELERRQDTPAELWLIRLANFIKKQNLCGLSVDKIHGLLKQFKSTFDCSVAQIEQYYPLPYSSSNVLYFRATGGLSKEATPCLLETEPHSDGYVRFWQNHIQSPLRVVSYPDTHFNLFEDPATLPIVRTNLRSFIRMHSHQVNAPSAHSRNKKRASRPKQLRTVHRYEERFKQEAIRLITEEGLSMREVGRQLKVTHSQISRWNRRLKQ